MGLRRGSVIAIRAIFSVMQRREVRQRIFDRDGFRRLPKERHLLFHAGDLRRRCDCLPAFGKAHQHKARSPLWHGELFSVQNPRHERIVEDLQFFANHVEHRAPVHIQKPGDILKHKSVGLYRFDQRLEVVEKMIALVIK